MLLLCYNTHHCVVVGLHSPLPYDIMEQHPTGTPPGKSILLNHKNVNTPVPVLEGFTVHCRHVEHIKDASPIRPLVSRSDCVYLAGH